VTQTEYQSIFEIGLSSFPWFTFLHPVPFILIGVLLFRFVKGKQIYQIVGILLAALATFIFLLGSLSLVAEFVADWRTYKRGDSSVVEGVVENFYPAPTLGASKESFSVHGIIFPIIWGLRAPVSAMPRLTTALSDRDYPFASITRTTASSE
jgi:hypothetical protein